MSDLQHQHHVHAFNNGREIAHIEHFAMPLIWAIVVTVLACLLWTTTKDYRDVLMNRVDAVTLRHENLVISKLLARCAAGESVPFDEGMMTCRMSKLVALK